MKKFFQQRWPWFFIGLLSLPVVFWSSTLILPPTPKSVIPFSAMLEETRTEFFFPTDYTYKLRSKATKEEFVQFVKKMKMEPYRISDDRYERKEQKGGLVTIISYLDGWITYEEIQT